MLSTSFLASLQRGLMHSSSGVRRSARLASLIRHTLDDNAASVGPVAGGHPCLDVQVEKLPKAKKFRAAAQSSLAHPHSHSDDTDVEIVAPLEGQGVPVSGVVEAEEEAGKAIPKRAHSPRPGPSREIEEKLWGEGYLRVAGVDEAGRGPLAGPVVAAACVIPAKVDIAGIRDSKQISESKREAIYEQLMQHPEVQCSVQVIEPEVIDSINILQATLRGMEQSVQQLPGGEPDFTLIDGNQLPRGLDAAKCQTIVKGDSKCLSIAAASILAKVTRDRIMQQYAKQYPQYGFEVHKGYPTKAHIAALQKHGQCPIHRRSFKLKNKS